MRFIALALVLTGCAGMQQYAQHDKNSASYKQCQYEARKATIGASVGAGVVQEIELINLCMAQKP